MIDVQRHDLDTLGRAVLPNLSDQKSTLLKIDENENKGFSPVIFVCHDSFSEDVVCLVLHPIYHTSY